MPALPYIAVALAAIGAGMAAYGQYKQGQTAQVAGEYNAKVSEANALAAQQKAGYEEEISREKLKRLMSTQRVLYAKAGVDITQGSPLLVLAETAAQGEKEALAIRYGGDVEAIREKNRSRLERLYGETGYQAGMIGAGSTFFSGLGQAGMGYAGATK